MDLCDIVQGTYRVEGSLMLCSAAGDPRGAGGVDDGSYVLHCRVERERVCLVLIDKGVV